MHENRETSEMPEAKIRDRPADEGNSHTVRVHVFEESDSGTVPMNHSNKSGQPLAESEEGRPLIKENTHQSSTLSTQSEARVSQGWTESRGWSMRPGWRVGSPIYTAGSTVALIERS